MDPELLLESKMDATWNTPQSLHNSSGGESFFEVSIAGVDAISKVDGAIDVGDERMISVVDKDAIRVDEAGAISVVRRRCDSRTLRGCESRGSKNSPLVKMNLHASKRQAHTSTEIGEHLALSRRVRIIGEGAEADWIFDCRRIDLY